MCICIIDGVSKNDMKNIVVYVEIIVMFAKDKNV